MGNSNDPNLSLSFSQRVGATKVSPLLPIGSLSESARTKLWHVLHSHLRSTADEYGYVRYDRVWPAILVDWAVEKDAVRAEQLSKKWLPKIEQIQEIFVRHPYDQPLDLLEYILRHKNCPPEFAGQVEKALRSGRTAYYVLDDRTIYPMATPEEAQSVQQAVEDLGDLVAPKTHLIWAAERLREGNYADSVRESIHAVESIASLVAGKSKSDLTDALVALEKKQHIHPALRVGFEKLYSYTSAEQGARHALLDSGAAKIDQIDASFMLGACASFVSYLNAKGRAAGLIG